MSRRDFFINAEALFTFALVMFFIFFKPDIDPYAGKTLKEGLIYDIVDYMLSGLMYLFVFAAILAFYIENKIKKVALILAMYSAIVTCEVLRLPLLEFPREIAERLKVYPYYGIALLVWSSIYIIDYLSIRHKEKS